MKLFLSQREYKQRTPYRGGGGRAYGIEYSRPIQRHFPAGKWPYTARRGWKARALPQ